MRWPTAWKAWRSTCSATSSRRSLSTRARRPPASPTGSATSAAPSPPTSHRVLLDNNRVRVLEVVIEPGTREPEHTHRAPSVMIIDEPTRIRYHQGGTLLFESQAPPGPRPGVRVRWMEPEGPHSVENT